MSYLLVILLVSFYCAAFILLIFWTSRKSTFGLSDRMKQYENKWIQKLDSSKPIVVRLDGRTFSNFTKSLGSKKSPIDDRLEWSFVQTCQDLLVEFGPTVIYSQSDEISLIWFPKIRKNGEYADLPFAGKTSKLCSCVASYAAARFNYYLSLVFSFVSTDETVMRMDGEHVACDNCKTYPQNVLDRMTSHIAHFDARAFQLPDENQVMNYLYWRGNNDCIRNSVNKYARHFYSEKQLAGESTKSKLELLKSSDNDWENLPRHFRYGFFVKLESFNVTVTNQELEKSEKVFRTRPCAFTCALNEWWKDRKSELLVRLKSKTFDKNQLQTFGGFVDRDGCDSSLCESFEDEEQMFLVAKKEQCGEQCDQQCGEQCDEQSSEQSSEEDLSITKMEESQIME